MSATQVEVLGCVVLALLVLVWVNAVRRKRERDLCEAKAAADSAKLAEYREKKQLYDEALKLVESPVVPPFNLDQEEKPFYVDRATLIFQDGERTYSAGNSLAKTTGGGTGAVIGGALLGPVGAIAGYAMSPKKTVVKSAPTYSVPNRHHEDGTLVVTDKRMVFIGDRSTTLQAERARILQITAKEVTPLPQLQMRVGNKMLRTIKLPANRVAFRRPDALPDEEFAVRNLAYFTMALERAGVANVNSISPPQLPPVSD